MLPTQERILGTQDGLDTFDTSRLLADYSTALPCLHQNLETTNSYLFLRMYHRLEGMALRFYRQT
jgi:hypothetical protein